MREIIFKEIKDYLKSKATIIYFIFLSLLTGYSFYSAMDLYSKASMAAVDNPLYATGFEPVPGVFVPTFGGLFIALSIVAPFMFINSISSEKRYNTIFLAFQYPMSFIKYFFYKVVAAVFILFLSLFMFIPIFVIWYLYGGHIPVAETILLHLEYFLYGLFIIGVSFLSAALFKDNSQASVFALALIMFSWFLDFGKEMNILPLINRVSSFSITAHLKNFENGILSLNSFFYIFLIFFLMIMLAYLFLTFFHRKYIPLIYIIGFVILNIFLQTFSSYDLSESKRNSFSASANRFLTSLPEIKIKIFLEPTDSRAKDYENGFLKKLRLIKKDVKVEYAKDKELNSHYGYFRYVITGKAKETTSNSDEEIFMILSELSGEKLETNELENDYKGYPLVATNFGYKIWIFYLIIIPLIILFVFYLVNYKKRSYSEKDI